MSKELVLTPDCQSLWILSPSILFLYDRIIMDQGDFDSLVNPKKDTKFSMMKAINMERLNKWGYIQTVSYEHLIDSETKENIHQQAEKVVEDLIIDSTANLENSRFINLTVFGHKEFSIYLQNCIQSCPIEDEETLKNYIIRYEKVELRIKQLETKKITDDLLENVAYSSKRATAKILAGLILTDRLNKSMLFDTKEYTPRIQDIIESDPSLIKLNYVDDVNHIPYDMIIAALSNKSVPEINFYDKWRLFSTLKEERDFILLKESIERISDYFSFLINRNPNIAAEKIKSEINKLEEEYTAILNRLKGKFSRKLTWRLIEMLVAQTIGFLSPWIDDVKQLEERSISKEVKSMFLTEKSLRSDLFFIGEQWKKFDFSDSRKYNRIRERIKTNQKREPLIWGESNSSLPWYESK